jgi:hypothetical protein
VIELHLYGKLRRFAANKNPAENSVVTVSVKDGDTIRDVLVRLGIPLQEVGNNIFLNWQYSALERRVPDNGRLAVFPDNMQLIYRWYFAKAGEDKND